jgi:acetyl esterase
MDVRKLRAEARCRRSAASSSDRLVRELAVGVSAAVVFVDYDRSPEARYPVAIEQAYATGQWITQHGRSERLDCSRLAVTGGLRRREHDRGPGDPRQAARRRREITASPRRASVEELAGLPDTFLIVDENDVLRDEGEAYARKLTAAGVRTTSARYKRHPSTTSG